MQMATVDEVLMQMDNETEIYTEEQNECVIDPVSRVIFVPFKYMLLGVESDKASTRIPFRCKRIVGDNIDLSEMELFVNCQNANKEKLPPYMVSDVKTDGEDVTFSWKLDRDVTKYKGIVKFIVCAKTSDADGNVTIEWNTTLATSSVLEGLETDINVTEDQEKDVVLQLVRMLDSKTSEKVKQIENKGEEIKNQIQNVTNETAQAKQIEQNKTDIDNLKSDINNVVNDKQNKNFIINITGKMTNDGVVINKLDGCDCNDIINAYNDGRLLFVNYYGGMFYLSKVDKYINAFVFWFKDILVNKEINVNISTDEMTCDIIIAFDYTNVDSYCFYIEEDTDENENPILYADYDYYTLLNIVNMEHNTFSKQGLILYALYNDRIYTYTALKSEEDKNYMYFQSVDDNTIHSIKIYEDNTIVYESKEYLLAKQDVQYAGKYMTIGNDGNVQYSSTPSMNAQSISKKLNNPHISRSAYRIRVNDSDNNIFNIADYGHIYFATMNLEKFGGYINIDFLDVNNNVVRNYLLSLYSITEFNPEDTPNAVAFRITTKNNVYPYMMGYYKYIDDEYILKSQLDSTKIIDEDGLQTALQEVLI